MLLRILREPLLHFVVIGVVIYSLMNSLAPSGVSMNERRIEISPSDLVSFMQQRDQVFDAELYTKKYNAMSATQQQAMARQYAEQEVLYREAKSLGLDQNDEVLRRRLIQKLKYFLEGLIQAQSQPGAAELQQFYDANKQDYLVPATATFTHLFFKQEGADPASAMARAEQALEGLVADKESYAVNSDSFPYHRNYVKKSAAQVARHFGNEFATSLFELSPQASAWQGPVISAYGAHLVQISQMQAAYYPAWEAIADKLLRDLQRSQFAAAQQAQINQLVDQYQIELLPQ